MMRRLSVALLMLACVGTQAQSNAVPTVQPRPVTPSATAFPALEQREIRAQLSPRRYTTLAAEIGARISLLPVPEGGAFKAGQRLVQFDCQLMQAQLNKSRAALKAAEKNWSANKQLVELQSVGKVELETSEAEFLKARAEVESNAVVVSKCVIAAPYAGRVAEQKVREQQFVQAGQPLLEILDDSLLELSFIVPSRWMSWLQAGTPFSVRIDETGKTYPAKVLRLAARVDPLSQSVQLTAMINGKFPELTAGMSGRVDIVPPPAGVTK